MLSNSPSGNNRSGEEKLNAEDSEVLKTPDELLDIVGSFGPFQKFFCFAFICMFSICSEFFHGIPFYALLPRLDCHIQKEDGTWEILEGCPKALACNLPKEQDYYSIDWNDGKSLQNWMTDMNLICEPAYRIGLIGSLQFVGLALGAVIFTPFADTYGRKPVLIFSVALTPIVMFSLLIFASNINHLYFWITFLSLSFSSRCSTSFMMGQEYLKKDMAIYFSGVIFIFDGIMSIFQAVVIGTTRSENVFLLFIGIVILVLWVMVYVYCPETPKYLYEKKQFRELEKCLLHVAYWNGKNVEEEIRYEIRKLKRASQNDISMIVEKPQNRMQILCRDKKLRNNLIASVYLSSAVGFSYYLITFYIKYFKGNIFVNFASIGVADAIGFALITKITPKYTIPEIIRILLVGSIASAILFMITQAVVPALLPIPLILMRMNIGGLYNYSYQYNSMLFPLLVKGAVFAMANSFARPSQAMATMVAEYIHEPIFLILTVSIISIFVSFLVTEKIEH